LDSTLFKRRPLACSSFPASELAPIVSGIRTAIPAAQSQSRRSALAAGAAATWVGTEWPWAKLLNTLDFFTRSGHTDVAAATVALQ
jgi:hypothetical protein